MSGDLIQALVNGLNAKAQSERADSSQLTLGRLIDKLQLLPGDTPVTGLGRLDSYRGYYEDLAFAPTDETSTVGELLTRCLAAMGQVFTGYKGGDYVMGSRTPVWVSAYGDNSGLKLLGFEPRDGSLHPVTEAEVWP